MVESKTKKEQAAQEEAVTVPVQGDPAAEAEAILEEARRQAAEIVAAAQQEAQTVQAPAQQGESDDDLVTIQLFRDNDKYKNDVFVAVNGQSCLIQRGKPVQIKRKFARVLEQSMSQDIAASELMDQEEKEFERQSKLYNV